MRPLTAARLLLGTVGLLLTRRVVPLWGADPCSERVVGVARVLATRHLVQGAVLAARPTRRTDTVSAAVDSLHGLTMVALAVLSPSYRRPAATSACLAVTFAALTGRHLQRGSRRHGRAHGRQEVGRVVPFGQHSTRRAAAAPAVADLI
jgi:hypothetical protein